MKFFQKVVSSVTGGSLSGAQLLLRDELLPAFRSLRENGYSAKEAGFALTNHFERTNTPIQSDKCLELLKDPETLILAYRKAKQKPNRPASNQFAVLRATFKSAGDQEKAATLLSEVLVLDALPSLVFKQCVQYLATHNLTLSGAPIERWRKHLA